MRDWSRVPASNFSLPNWVKKQDKPGSCYVRCYRVKVVTHSYVQVPATANEASSAVSLLSGSILQAHVHVAILRYPIPELALGTPAMPCT
mmetsp:Transcript_16502/g.25003  ORF Transcript_16502/g.25003 Transcript_16502/m.25003 type:complete len:90 (+) Transcript_16502:290-559(+)